MRSKRMCARSLVAGGVAATGIALVAMCSFAFGTPVVTGADYYGNGAVLNDAEVDVMTVEGASGERLYLKVQQGDKVIGDRIVYKMTDNPVADDNNSDGTRGATVKLGIKGLDLYNSTYTVTAYADRSESTPLKTVSVQGVYAKLPTGEQKLVGTHAAGAGESNTYQPSTSLYLDGKNYRLDDLITGVNPTTSDNRIVYSYSEYSEANSITGTITYVDVNGTEIKSVSYPGIIPAGSLHVDVEPVVTEEIDGSIFAFRTISHQDSVELSYDGQHDYTFECKAMSQEPLKKDSFLVGRVNMVCGEELIASDHFNILGTYLYTMPKTIYKNKDGKSYTYEISEESQAVQSFDLNAANETRNIQYNLVASSDSNTEVTFTYINGIARDDETRILGTSTATVSPENAAAAPEASNVFNGTSYDVAGKVENYTYQYGSSKIPNVNVYCVPAGYKPSSSAQYDVTVTCVNLRTGDVIKSKKFPCSETSLDDMSIQTEGEFTLDGVDYVRLDGQDDPIVHSYYSDAREYTVYYRDKNDTLTSGTVINRIRVVYADGATSTAPSNGNAANAQEGRLNAAGTYNVIDGAGNNASLTNESGVDTETERIDDNQTPLASAGKLRSDWSWLYPAGGATVAMLALFALLVVLIRKDRQNSKKRGN